MSDDDRAVLAGVLATLGAGALILAFILLLQGLGVDRWGLGSEWRATVLAFVVGPILIIGGPVAGLVLGKRLYRLLGGDSWRGRYR